MTEQTCAYCGYKCSAGANEVNFAVMAEHIKSCPKHPLAKALAELAQARTELKSLQGARHKCERRLAAAKDSRDYWHETSLSAEAERGKACKEAQEQSDLVQREWLSPAEAEGLRRQLADARRVARLWFRRAHEPMVEVEITGKEMVEALQDERALRQVAETSERASRKMLARQCDMARTAETEAMKAKRELAETEQRAERAEALAALVTPELAVLLERLGKDGRQGVVTKEAALELAAQIREALDDT